MNRGVYRRASVLMAVLLGAMLLAGLVWAGTHQVQGNRAGSESPFVIGVSQPNLNEPRQVAMYNEIRKAAESYPNLRLVFTDAAESTEKQMLDVRKLMDYEVDLLIVSLNDSEAMTPVLNDVYRKIPLIVLGRGVTGYDYSLYIGPDNRSIGRKSGLLAEKLLGDQAGQIIEIQGLPGATSVMENSQGFHEVVGQLPAVKIAGTVSGQWQRDKAEDELAKILPAMPDVRLVYAHSDAMALGAYRALQNLNRRDIRIIGIDGLETENGGIELVKQGIVSGTVTSPTGGKEAVRYAVDILNEVKGLPKKVILRSQVVTKDTLSGLERERQLREQAAAERVAAGEEKPIRLGYVQVGSESSWRVANNQSIREAAGKEKSIELTVRNADGSQERQIGIIRDFIRERMDVIAFSPIVETGWEEVLAEAKQAGIPVLLTDRKVKAEDDSLWTTFIGSDFVEEGRRAARWLIDHDPEGKPSVRVLEIEGTEGSAPAIERKEGFRQIMDGQRRFVIASSKKGEFTLESGKRRMQEALKEGPPPDVVFAHNDDMALGAIQAIEEAKLKPGKDVRVISVDATRQAFQAMIAGKLEMTVECNPLLGPEIMKAVKDLADGKEMPISILKEEGVFSKETAKRDIVTRKY